MSTSTNELSRIKIHSLLYWLNKVNASPENNPYRRFWEARKYKAYMKYYVVCPHCNNDGQNYVPHDYQYTVECFCGTLEQWSETPETRVLESYYQLRTLDEIEDYDDPPGAAKETRANLLSIEKRFVNPARWMVLTGGTGSAKTHILYALRYYFRQYAWYLTSSDFVEKLMVTTKANKADEFIEKLIDAPILLFDDFGLEHISKSQYALNILAHIIDQRYSIGKDAPVWMSTNLSPIELASQQQDITVKRITSRFIDRNISWMGYFTQADYRIIKSLRKEAEEHDRQR